MTDADLRLAVELGVSVGAEVRRSTVDPSALVVDVDPIRRNAFREGRFGMLLRRLAEKGAAVGVLCDGRLIATIAAKGSPIFSRLGLERPLWYRHPKKEGDS